jgi:hypothetical protein
MRELVRMDVGDLAPTVLFRACAQQPANPLLTEYGQLSADDRKDDADPHNEVHVTVGPEGNVTWTDRQGTVWSRHRRESGQYAHLGTAFADLGNRAGRPETGLNALWTLWRLETRALAAAPSLSYVESAVGAKVHPAGVVQPGGYRFHRQAAGVCGPNPSDGAQDGEGGEDDGRKSHRDCFQ